MGPSCCCGFVQKSLLFTLQWLLSNDHAVRAEHGLLSENKEGLFSCLGYWALCLLGVSLGSGVGQSMEFVPVVVGALNGRRNYEVLFPKRSFHMGSDKSVSPASDTRRIKRIQEDYQVIDIDLPHPPSPAMIRPSNRGATRASGWSHGSAAFRYIQTVTRVAHTSMLAYAIP